MRDLNDLSFFASVVDHGGFSAAGRALGIQKSKLSRRILLLEERLGVRLLNRSSRRFSVTEVGRDVYDRCVAMLVEAEAAEQIVAESRAEPRGVVRMSCPTALLSFQFGPLLARFMIQNPGVRVHLESTNRRVDVVAEGFDLAIRVRFPPLEPTELVMRRLDGSSQCLVASPALLDRVIAHRPIFTACPASTLPGSTATMPGSSTTPTGERQGSRMRHAWSPTMCRSSVTPPSQAREPSSCRPSSSATTSAPGGSFTSSPAGGHLRPSFTPSSPPAAVFFRRSAR